MIDQATRLREIINQKKPFNSVIENPKEDQETNARVICITSGKGGVGKTNFTSNLAISLGKLNKRVVIIDADLGLANVDVVLGVIPEYTLLDVIKDNKDITEVMKIGPEGIKIISGGSGILDLVDMPKESLSILIEEFDKIQEHADIILIDTGAGLSKSVLSFALAAKEVIIVATPEPTSITDAYAMIKTIVMEDSNKDIKVIINRVDDMNEGSIAFNKLKNVSKKFLNIEIEELGFIPEDISVRKAVKAQSPFLLEYPNSFISESIEKIALKLTNEAVDKNKLMKSQSFIKRVLSFFR